jgi:2-methylisocitrate lyase-like PEP mutase family enzyme
MTTFTELHHGRLPLLLPNAWDVASALAFAGAGHPAVGTTSMGLAATEGHPDGQRASRVATARLAEALAVVDVHVSIDIEDGYADEPASVAAFVDALPVAGVNIEDSSRDQLVPPAALAAKVDAIKSRRPDVFVNARVDTYWLDQDATEEDTLHRAREYVAAGADGIFVPGITDHATIERLAAEIRAPMNVLAVPGTSLERLGDLGVRRVSTGSLPYRAALQAALRTAESVRTGATPPDAVAYPGLQDSLVAFAASASGSRSG